MGLDYDIHLPLEGLDEVIQDYTEWFTTVAHAVFYRDELDGDFTVSRPVSFFSWLDKIEHEKALEQNALRKLVTLHDNLIGHADGLVKQAKATNTKPEYKNFKQLTVLFEEFISYIRRLEKDNLLENCGIDALTGLRSREVLKSDVYREMERLARHGKPFVISLLRIDDYESLAKNLGTEKAREKKRLVAEMIRKCTRPFDDAYNYGNGYFVLCLKQTDSDGGIRALQRLKDELDRRNEQGQTIKEGEPLSISSCVAEPVPNEDFETLLENLKEELGNYSRKQGATLEYFELSPLQRYIQEEKEGL